MVTGTRSGHMMKEESPVKSKMGNSSRKEKDIKGSPSNTKNRLAVGTGDSGKGSTVSCSSADSSTLRKSCDQALTNDTSPSPNTRRSKRLASCEPSVSPDKRDPEEIDDEITLSQLRRSKRIKEHPSSSSSGLAESKKSCSPLDNSKQKNTPEDGKLIVINVREETMNMKPSVRPAKLVAKKKKRLSARAYVAALLESVKSIDGSRKDIGVRGAQENGGTLLHVESFTPRSRFSEDAQGLQELYNGKEEMIQVHGPSEKDPLELKALYNGKEEMIKEHGPSEFDKVPSEGSLPNSREVANRTLDDHMEGKLAYSDGKEKVHSNEMKESGHEGSCSDAKCIDGSLVSSPSRATARSISDETERPNYSARGILQATDLTDSISEGEPTPVKGHDAVEPFVLSSPSCIKNESIELFTVSCKQKKLVPDLTESISGGVPTHEEVDDAIGPLQSLKMDLDHHSAAPVAPVNSEVHTSNMVIVDIVSSSPSGVKDQSIELCTVCCKQKRENDDSKTQGFCSCEGNFISFSQGVCAPKTVPESYKYEMMACSGKDGSAKMSKDSFSKGREKSFDCQRDINLTSLPDLFHTSTTEEDRRPRDTDCVDSTGETSSLWKASFCATQSNAGDNCCLICKRPGCLLCCDGKGCKGSYHLSCIDPPLKEVPPGNWYCFYCVKKKIEFGFHSVSEGVETVLDSRLVDSAYSDGACKGKQYLVKYKGLAYVHNRWLQEQELLVEAPSLLGRFNRRKQRGNVALWKEEWTVPQRLLQKRLLMRPELADECFRACGSSTSSCYYEWLVKWTGLGYEHATWEFENSSFLCTPEAMALKRDFESRHRNTKKSSNPSKADKMNTQFPISQLPLLPESCPTVLDGDYLSSVNKLREYWRRAQDVVFLEEQERIMKVILFILSVDPDVSRPFLIISTSTSLPLWESEFRRLAPSVNVVGYSGNKDVRTMIRSLEFFGEGGCIKFQVLLSLPHAIIEDYDALHFIGWEALVVDDCQNLVVSKHLEHLKKLSVDFNLILLNSQLKDNIADYLNLLSFLDSRSSQCSFDVTDVSCTTDIPELALLKNRLSRYIAHNHKVDCSKFLEYWIPVELSTVQLEQYCATLITHSLSLLSFSKYDHVGAFRDILVSQRKCCDHPYLVDEFLQAKLTKDVQPADYLDIGVKASGKLELLDRILQQMKDRGQRVVILFQLVGSDRKSTIGDILDDFLRQRFGLDSYERVESWLPGQKKQSALSKFNNKDNGRFVFLTENRACLPSIRLSSVDAVIIFSSDWNPGNDLKALQKISLESPCGYVKVFRLYSAFTVEEKALILAKQDKTLESNIPNINPSVSQSLLSWGSSYMFNKLDEFHRIEGPTICSTALSDKPILEEVLGEFLMLLPQDGRQEHTTHHSIVSMAQLSGAGYSKDILLLGEKKMPCHSEEPPQILWSSLLDGRHPRWRFISGSSQRARRKPSHPETLLQQPEVENDETRKKRRKTVNSSGSPKLPDDTCVLKSKSFPVDIPKEQGPSAHNGDVCPNQVIAARPDCTSARTQIPTPESEERESPQYSQRNLHLLLEAELSNLCETLRLSGDVTNMAQLLLEYVINNHRVSQEPETILQAFKISLCWRAACIVKPKLDHRISLLLARKHLNYGCTEQEAESVYSKLRMLKKRFRKYVELKSHSPLNNSSSRKGIEGEPLNEKDPVPGAFVCQDLVGETKWSQGNHRCPERQSLPGQDQTPILEVPLVKHHPDIGQLKGEFQSKCIGLIEKISSKRKEKLLQKQQLEEKEFRKFREHETAKQQKAFEELVDFISATDLPCEVQKEKKILLQEAFSNRMEKFEEHMKGQRRKLAVLQVEARNKEEQILKCWLAEAHAGTLTESFDEIPLADTGFTPDEFRDADQLRAYDSLRNAMSICGEYESSCSFVGKQTVFIHQDNVPANVLPPTSSGTSDDLPGAGMVALPDVQGVENYTEPACAPTSTSSEIRGPSPWAHALLGFDNSLQSHQEVGTVTVPDTQAVENNEESECAHMSTSSEIQEPSPAAQALSNCNVDLSFSTHQVPSNPHERPPPLDGFDSGQCLNSSQAVTDSTTRLSDSPPAKLHPTSSYSVPAQSCSTLQSPDSVPVQSLPSDDVMVHDSDATLPELHSGLPPLQPIILCTSGATEGLQELISSCPITIPSTQSENEHDTGENHSLNPVQLTAQDSSGTGVNLRSTSLDGLETGQRMTSSDENTFTSLDESSRLATSQIEPSDQPLEQTAALDGLDAGEMNFSQNLSQEIIESSLQVQAIADLSTGQCDIAHAGTPGLRDEVTGDTFFPPDEVQISAEQSFGLIASQAGPSDMTGTIGQELNSLHHTSLEIPATAEPTSNSVHDNPFAHQVQLLPVDSLGTTSSQAGQLIVGMQPSASIFLGIMDNLTSVIEEPNNHLLQSRSMVPQASLHDPLQNELHKIRKEDDRDAEICEKEKQRLKLELEKELEQIRKKYDSLIKDLETKRVERKRTFTILHDKVSLNRNLSGEFRSRFFERRDTSKVAASQGRAASCAPQVLVHVSQPQIAVQRDPSASASAAFPLVSLGHVPASAVLSRLEQATLARARAAGPAVSSASPSSGPPVQVVHHSSALFSSNPAVRHTGPVLAPRLNYQAGSSRAPAPHLLSFRANAPTPTSNSPLRPRGSLNQPQLPSHAMSSMPPPQLVSTPLSFQRPDPISGIRWQENLSMRPVHAASQPMPPSFAADVVGSEGAGRSVPNFSPSIEVEQQQQQRGGSSAHASAAPGQTTPTSEAVAAAAAAPADVICLADD